MIDMDPLTAIAERRIQEAIERGEFVVASAGGTRLPMETETVRHQILALLEEGPRTAKEISSAVRRPEKEIANHLEHLRKSLRSEGRRLFQVPAECRECGFVFRKRDRLKAPSRCPVCKGEAISDPSFRVNDRF